MNRRKIAVIAGLDSSEREISLRSAAEVCAALDREIFEPYIVTVRGREWKEQLTGADVDKNCFGFISNGKLIEFDYVVSMIHGTPGENGILQGYFEIMGIPYAGCDVEVSALTFNKSLCKRLICGVSHVALAKEILVRKGDIVDTLCIVEQLGLPLFVKPNASGSSCGVTKVKSDTELQKAVDEALKEGDTVLLEEYIEGTEVSHGVMIIGDQEFVMPVTELVSKNEFFDYQAKYTDGMTQEITPARIPDETTQKLNQATLEIYKRLSCRGVVRIDYIIKDGTPYFIEVNTTPGMSRNSIIPQQWRAIGYSMQDAFTMIINNKPL